MGPHLVERLTALQQKHDIIGDVRGRGLMLGIELVRDRQTKVTASARLYILIALQRSSAKSCGDVRGRGLMLASSSCATGGPRSRRRHANKFTALQHMSAKSFGGVRGRGLMLGTELVRDRQTKVTASAPNDQLLVLEQIDHRSLGVVRQRGLMNI